MDKEYLSKYTEGKVTAAQYLTDIACERIAKNEKEVLPKKYWRSDRWIKHFRRQIVAANSLLKEFSCSQIVNALNSPRGRKIFSLGLKKPIKEIVQSNLQKTIDSTKTSKDLPTAKWDDDWPDELPVRKTPKKKSTWEELQ